MFFNDQDMLWGNNRQLTVDNNGLKRKADIQLEENALTGYGPDGGRTWLLTPTDDNFSKVKIVKRSHLALHPALFGSVHCIMLF